MEQEPYGAWGRMYEYRDREGIIHSSCYSLEGDTEITYDELYKINDNYELEALYTNFDSLSQILFCPENEIKYYFDLNEISKEQYDEYFENVQDYIHFFDRINSFKDDKLLSSILSSHQYVSLMNYGSEDIDENELDALITEMYYKTGEEGENLYNIILGMIS